MSTTSSSTPTWVDILVAIFLPPLGVYLKFGCSVELWICIALTLLGYIPGIIYAVWVIASDNASTTLQSAV
ncbi:hypothetical protein MLD38_039778 [Melastoma candidum]|uniref:Uncharacterized protein n=1 Tax=Melastoma candidum TaxID=119954 RepID=A0ACB9L4S9_9MYRT|nr:hypothetical protein MLD38_039778 [Melastoma candidum]